MTDKKWQKFITWCVKNSYTLDDEEVIRQYNSVKDIFWEMANGAKYSDRILDKITWFNVCDFIVMAFDEDENVVEACEFVQHMKDSFIFDDVDMVSAYMELYVGAMQNAKRYAEVEAEIDRLLKDYPKHGYLYALRVENHAKSGMTKANHKKEILELFENYRNGKFDDETITNDFFDVLSMHLYDCGCKKELKELEHHLDAITGIDSDGDFDEDVWNEEFHTDLEPVDVIDDEDFMNLYTKIKPILYLVSSNIQNHEEPFWEGAQKLFNRGYSQEEVEQVYAHVIFAEAHNQVDQDEEVDIDVDGLVETVMSIDMNVFPDDLIAASQAFNIPMYSLMSRYAYEISDAMLEGDEQRAVEKISQYTPQLLKDIDIFQTYSGTDDFEPYYNFESIVGGDVREAFNAFLCAMYDNEIYDGCRGFAQILLDTFTFEEDEPLYGSCRIYIAKSIYGSGDIQESYNYISKWQLEKPNSFYPSRALLEVYTNDDPDKAVDLAKKLVDEPHESDESLISLYLYLVEFFYNRDLKEYGDTCKEKLKEFDIDYDVFMEYAFGE